MSLTTYCDFDEVRSALGVNDIELKDTVLALPVYEMGLVRELNKLSTSLNAAFSTVAAMDSGDRTVDEVAFYSAVRLFSVYAVAKQVGVSLPLLAPKDVGDGKATVSRFAGTPFETVMANVEDYFSALKTDLRLAYETLTSVPAESGASAVPAVVFLASKRTYDPVTGS